MLKKTDTECRVCLNETIFDFYGSHGISISSGNLYKSMYQMKKTEFPYFTNVQCELNYAPICKSCYKKKVSLSDLKKNNDESSRVEYVLQDRDPFSDIEDKKNPGIATLISICLPGGGQLYNGQIQKGLLILGGAILMLSVAIAIAGLFIFFIGVLSLSIYSIADAYKTANIINKSINKRAKIGMKNCPFCAENIKYEAIVCRYCGKELPDPYAS